MSSSTSSSRGSAPLFLAALAGGLMLAVAAFSALDESWIHQGNEYGMAEAFEDQIEAACAEKISPDVLIVGDSRAVAGVSVKGLRAAGIDAHKFAQGGAGPFVGWAVLDRLVDCGVRPKNIVMAYGTIHVIAEGAIIERAVNFDWIKGPTAARAWRQLAEWELPQRPHHSALYTAISLVGEELSLADLATMRPELRSVLEKPGLIFERRRKAEQERVDYTAASGDRYYGVGEKADGLPEEGRFEMKRAPVNLSVLGAVADIGKANGIPVYFYLLPLSETARAKVDPRLFELTDEFLDSARKDGIVTLNSLWSLPDTDFGDPSHVNHRGRVQVTADFIRRLASAQERQGAE
jgi:hypothetical protein